MVSGHTVRPFSSLSLFPLSSLDQNSPFLALLCHADVPGWKNTTHREFDPRESSIVPSIRTASYKINSLKPPSHPTPSPPSKPWQCRPNHLCFAGSAWAERYEVIVRGEKGEERKECWDCTKEDEFMIDLGRELGKVGGAQGARVSVRAFGVDGHPSEEGEALVL